MADGVTVDLGALTTFAATMAGVADAESTQAVGDSGNLNGLSQVMRMSTGAPEGPDDMCYVPSGFLEAEDFAARHDVMAQSALQFMSDAVVGIASLALAAETCASRYAATDLSNASALSRVSVGDGTGPKFAGLTVRLHGNATVTSSDVLDVFTPTGDEVMLSAPVLNTGGTGDPGSATGAIDPTNPATVPTTPAGTKKSQSDFDAEVRTKLTELKDHQVIQPDSPAQDPGQGFTIGQDPTLQVQADTAKMPAKPQLPSTLARK
jgi:hypothetical protein